MKKTMLHFIISYLTLLYLSTMVYAQGAYVLQDKIIVPNSDQTEPVVEFDEEGGNITYDVVYNGSCRGTYQMSWTFSKDITRLEIEDTFSINLQCISCQDVCGFRWGTAQGNTGGANNITSISGLNDYVYNGNMEQISGSGNVQAWNPERFTQDYEFRVKLYKDAPYTAFYLTIGSHQIIYLYYFDSASTDSGSEDRYDDGYQAGVQYCKDNPEACGWNDRYDDGFQDGQATFCDSSTPTDSTGGCAVLEENFDITMPCIDVFGTKFPINLEKFTNTTDPFGYYWKLNLE